MSEGSNLAQQVSLVKSQDPAIRQHAPKLKEDRHMENAELEVLDEGRNEEWLDTCCTGSNGRQ